MLLFLELSKNLEGWKFSGRALPEANKLFKLFEKAGSKNLQGWKFSGRALPEANKLFELSKNLQGWNKLFELLHCALMHLRTCSFVFQRSLKSSISQVINQPYRNNSTRFDHHACCPTIASFTNLVRLLFYLKRCEYIN